MMENLTQLESLFLELFRSLSDQQQEDVMRILDALRQSVE